MTTDRTWATIATLASRLESDSDSIAALTSASTRWTSDFGVDFEFELGV